jgi:hypothetical protein
MHWLRGLAKRIRALVHPDRADHDLDDEIGFHLEQETAKNIALGLAPDEARRRALVAFGGVAQTREQHRDVRAVRWFADLIADARFALRGCSSVVNWSCWKTLLLWAFPLGDGDIANAFSGDDCIVCE